MTQVSQRGQGISRAGGWGWGLLLAVLGLGPAYAQDALLDGTEGEGASASEPAGSEAPVVSASQGTGLMSFGGGSGDRPDTYEVVKGDTMWEISARFWGDPYFWPTLWSYNPGIGNAHFIYPADVLRFTTGSPVRPPGMTFDGEPQSPQATQPTSSAPDIWSPAHMEETGVSNALECAPPLPFSEDPPGSVLHSSVTGFLTQEEIQSVGKVVRSPEDHIQLVTRDVVYLSFAHLSDVSCGDVFSIYRPLVSRVRHPEHRFRRLGAIYEVTGEVRVVDLNDHVATAVIINAYGEITRNDLVMDFFPVDREVELRAATKEVEGFIVGSMRSNDDSISVRDLVYIDRGDADGLAAGDAFYIVRRGDGLTTVSHRGEANLPDDVIGKLVVVDLGETISTAIVVESADILKVGDRVSMRVF